MQSASVSEFSVNEFVVPNPKLYADTTDAQERKIYPYYAGYSSAFADATLKALGANSGHIVLDPWNGSGTTTSAAIKLGCDVVGLDLNPAMVLISKAQLVSGRSANDIFNLFCEGFVGHDELHKVKKIENDPLLAWLTPSAVAYIRNLESAASSLIGGDCQSRISDLDSVDLISPSLAFLYVALFRTVRALLIDFVPSNPTWVKKPRKAFERKRPSSERIFHEFISQLKKLALSSRDRDGNGGAGDMPRVSLVVANSECIPVEKDSVDFVVTSPPYCTRIDYAVATSIELAVLGINDDSFLRLRRSLMGGTTVLNLGFEVNPGWGQTCIDFLDAVKRHPAKASGTYYLKTHVQYFDSLYKSMLELGRVLKTYGRLVMVVQDSHYKELRNDLATIVSEMALSAGFELSDRADFCSGRSMAQLNSHVKKYRTSGSAVESVLCFTKVGEK